MKPLIGVTPSMLDEERGRYLTNRDYMDAVLRAGAVPVILPLTEDESALDEALNAVDGVLFSGGADLSPSLYGEETSPECGKLCPIRDQTEMYLIRRCLRENIPMLCVCRGFELLNVALGGKLYQDLPSQRPESLNHTRHDEPAGRVHQVNLVPGTLLHEITGLDQMGVNSRHHQGVKEKAPEATVSAVSEDGLVEGLELTDHPFAVGIQWHPESLSSFAPEAQRLFDALSRQAQMRRMAHSGEPV